LFPFLLKFFEKNNIGPCLPGIFVSEMELDGTNGHLVVRQLVHVHAVRLVAPQPDDVEGAGDAVVRRENLVVRYEINVPALHIGYLHACFGSEEERSKKMKRLV
jgi:hypothetical protein